jgi:alkylhydroperoxidase/carboxymuconolactone decarboxylase family protein YurZ
MDDARDAEQRLKTVRAKRGYLLPHHGLLAVAAPDLLDAYDAAYTALTLRPRHLSAHDKEFVWLAVLVTTDEAIATHHIAKFRQAGGTESEIEAAIRLAGVARSADSFAFVGAHWQLAIPKFARERAYRDAVAAALAPAALPDGLTQMALATVQACRKAWFELALHIRDAYAAGVPETHLAEALSITMFPGSVPNFVDACGVWLDLIRRGEVAASPSFRAWAAIDQGGFDGAQGAQP